ncbi:ABC transporter ATP-binding protein [Streptomyces sp. NPDC059517]|uniref:ABC transporter ATP-binding protein n=1 Tax=Streptomyces sp. NPDC059517 TaxID=3346855 RepID=UPI003697CFF4
MTPPYPAVLPVAEARLTRRETLRRLRSHRARAGSAAVALTAAAAAAVTAPPLLGAIVDAVLDDAGVIHVVALGAALGLATAVAALLGLLGGRLLTTVTQATLAGLREDAFAAALRLPPARIEASGTSDVVSRVTRDVESVSEAASDLLPDLLDSALAIALTVVALAVLDPRLALAGLLGLPVHLYVTRRFLTRSRPVYRDIRLLESERGQSVLEAVHGADTVRAYRDQERVLTTVAERSERAIGRQRDGVRLRNAFVGGLNAAEFLGLSAVLATGFVLLSAGEITVGTATAAALAFHRLFGPIGAVLGSLDDVQRATVGLSRLVGLTTQVPAAPGPHPADSASGAGVEVREVSYAYDGRPALDRVSLRIAPGTTMALVGASGSGKSTLAHLVAGLTTPDGGEVLLGGAPADPARGAYLVTQETHLFRGTLADNLRLARPDASRQALAAALRDCGAHWAFELPDGLDTRVGADGVPLDEAAVQHLALARVLLADPPVVVLDEATAESGAGPRAALHEALASVTRDRTALVVAHHLHQARRADLVAVLADGRTAELGTHEELSAAGGTYADLWSAAAGHVPPPSSATTPAAAPASVTVRASAVPHEGTP